MKKSIFKFALALIFSLSILNVNVFAEQPVGTDATSNTGTEAGSTENADASASSTSGTAQPADTTVQPTDTTAQPADATASQPATQPSAESVLNLRNGVNTASVYKAETTLDGDMFISKDGTNYDTTTQQPIVVEEPINTIKIGSFLDVSKIRDQVVQVAADILGQFNNPALYSQISLADTVSTFQVVITLDSGLDAGAALPVLKKYNDATGQPEAYNGIWSINSAREGETSFVINFSIDGSNFTTYEALRNAIVAEPNLFLELENVKIKDNVLHETNYSVKGDLSGSFSSKASAMGVSRDIQLTWNLAQKAGGADSVVTNGVGATLKFVRQLRTVKYSFEKADGTILNLPAELIARLPQDARIPTKTLVDTSAINVSNYEDVANNGTWSFVGWDKANATVGADDITFVGKWKFTLKTPSNPSTPTPSTPTTVKTTTVQPKAKWTCADEGKVWNESKQMCVVEATVKSNTYKVPNTSSLGNIFGNYILSVLSIAGLVVIKKIKK